MYQGVLKITTIIGVKTLAGEEGIVLCADTQLSIVSAKGKKDETLEDKGELVYKIICGPNWALGTAGRTDSADVQNFLKLMQAKKETQKEKAYQMVKQALENVAKPKYDSSHFPEVNQLNTMLKRGGEDLDDLPLFILATNKPYMGLWVLDQFGNLIGPDKKNRIEFVCIGSGEDDVTKYIVEERVYKEKVDLTAFDIPNALDLVVEALHKAEKKDVYTGGPLDIAILTKTEIYSYGKVMRQDIEYAEKRRLELIKEEHAPKPEKTLAEKP